MPKSPPPYGAAAIHDTDFGKLLITTSTNIGASLAVGSMLLQEMADTGKLDLEGRLPPLIVFKELLVAIILPILVAHHRGHPEPRTDHQLLDLLHHIADEAFADCLALTDAPATSTHSPGHA